MAHTVRVFDDVEHAERSAQCVAIRAALADCDTDQPTTSVEQVVTGVLVDLVTGEGSAHSVAEVLVEHGLGGAHDLRVAVAAQSVVDTVPAGGVA